MKDHGFYSNKTLSILCILALILSYRIISIIVSDSEVFPISTVKIAANYEHITRQQIEDILGKYLENSFVLLSTKKLTSELSLLEWADAVHVSKLWPDTLKIVLTEKRPIAVWNDFLLSDKGVLFGKKEINHISLLPKLSGPDIQKEYVLQIYKKLSKILTEYNLQIKGLALRENQAWELWLNNGILIRLGKQDLEQRIIRFCKAYKVLFKDKIDELNIVDLRYAHGMAVQWQQTTR